MEHKCTWLMDEEIVLVTFPTCVSQSCTVHSAKSAMFASGQVTVPALQPGEDKTKDFLTSIASLS